jgi:hypothetical protein
MTGRGVPIASRAHHGGITVAFGSLRAGNRDPMAAEDTSASRFRTTRVPPELRPSGARDRNGRRSEHCDRGNQSHRDRSRMEIHPMP